MTATYKIGEAATLLNLKTYVLRFWETEFPQINPLRTEKGQRLYTEKHIALLEHIRFLLHDRGLTIEGARKELAEELRSGESYTRPAAAEKKELTPEKTFSPIDRPYTVNTLLQSLPLPYHIPATEQIADSEEEDDDELPILEDSAMNVPSGYNKELTPSSANKNKNPTVGATFLRQNELSAAAVYESEYRYEAEQEFMQGIINELEDIATLLRTSL